MSIQQALPLLARPLELVERYRMLVFERAVPLMFYFRSHLRLMSTLKSPGVADLHARHPKIKYKYLRNSYLAESLATPDALDIMHYHYQYLSGKVGQHFFAQIFDARTTLWEHEADGKSYRIAMSFPRDMKRAYRMLDHEGDLSLTFEANGVPLYVLCMTIVPGSVASKCWQVDGCERAMFVGRIQGIPGKFDELRAATKAMRDITPARLLLSAVESISRTLDIDRIAGISTGKQLSRQKPDDEVGFFDYDAFWTSVGAELTSSGIYSVARDIPDKPIELVQQKHRSRTLAKRRFKKTVGSEIETRFSQEFLKKPDPSSTYKNTAPTIPARAPQHTAATLA